MTHIVSPRFLMLLTLLCSTLVVTQHAAADPWTEVGDAGQLPGTAQVTVGVGALTAIRGMLPTDTSFPPTAPPDIDLFRIFIDDPANFSATTVDPETEFIDTQLYLFRADGTGVVANSDTSATESRSTIPAGTLSIATAPPGEYLIGIALFESRPLNSTGDFLFPDLLLEPPGAVVPPDLPDDPLADWQAFPLFEPFTNYQINLTGASFAAAPPPEPNPIPEPASLLIWTILLLLAFYTSPLKTRCLKLWGGSA